MCAFVGAFVGFVASVMLFGVVCLNWVEDIFAIMTGGWMDVCRNGK